MQRNLCSKSMVSFSQSWATLMLIFVRASFRYDTEPYPQPQPRFHGRPQTTRRIFVSPQTGPGAAKVRLDPLHAWHQPDQYSFIPAGIDCIGCEVNSERVGV